MKARRNYDEFRPGEYSVHKMKDYVRDQLKSYHIRVLRALTSDEVKVIDKEIAKIEDKDLKKAKEAYLIRLYSTVFEIDTLGLDKGEAIGRTMAWIGDAKKEKGWRIDVFENPLP